MKKLGFGFMRLPLLDSDDQTSVDYKQIEQMVDTFLERGFTYFDTAYMYHNYVSERVIKKTLVDRHPRDSFTVATKMPSMFLKEESDLPRIFDEQLEKTGVTFFDYYLLHNLDRNNYEKAEKFNAFDFVLNKKAEGKIKQVGFSFHDKADLLDTILTKHPEVDFVQLQINYLDWDNEGIQSRKCYETAVKHGKKVIVMEPVKGGTLANVPEEAANLMKSKAPEASIPSWAIRYAAGLENVMVVLSGMSNMEQLLDNTGYMQDFKPLDNEDQKIVSKVVEIITGSKSIPCTACRYCVEGCPMKIAIPDYFSLYNNKIQENKKGFSIVDGYYHNLTKEYGKASACIACGKCEKSCPQHIKIIDCLKDVAASFEK